MDYTKKYRLMNYTPSKTVFAVENFEEKDIDRILDISKVTEVAYNKEKLILEISTEDGFSLHTLLKEIKLKIPESVFYKDNGSPQNNPTYASTIISNFIDKGDASIAQMSKGFVNSQDIIFLGSLGMSIEELIRNPVMPKWYDWFRMAQSAHTNIQTKQEIKSVEEEINVDDEVYMQRNAALGEDIKKLADSIEEIKQLLKEKGGSSAHGVN